MTPAGQLAMAWGAAQLGLDGLAYAPAAPLEPPEGANRSLGPSHDLSHGTSGEVGEGTAAPPSLPLPGQLALDVDALAAAPQLGLWKRLDVAHALLAGGKYDRDAKCQRTRRVAHGESVYLHRHRSGAYTTHGLVRCGKYTCPSCGPQRGRATSSKLAVAFQRHLADDLGYADVWMLTQAIPHTLDEPLVDVIDRLYAASEAFWRTKEWRAFAKRYDVAGRVRVLDATHGGPNGSHPHFHIALFPRLASVTWAELATETDEVVLAPGAPVLARPLPVQPLRACDKRTRERKLAEIVGPLRAAWLRCVQAQRAVADVGSFARWALQLSGGEKASAYFVKWGLADEVGASSAKSRSHLRLLDAVEAGQDRAGDVYRQFREAVDGHAWVTGLADVCNRLAVTDDDAAAYLAELRRRREVEAEREGTPLVDVRELHLEIRAHLYAGAVALGWESVTRIVDELDGEGLDVDGIQAELEKRLFTARCLMRRPRDSTAPPPS